MTVKSFHIANFRRSIRHRGTFFANFVFKSNLMKACILLLFFIGFALPATAQTDTTVTDDWQYFTLPKNTFVTIVEYHPAVQPCGTRSYASVTIGKKENGELIRIISECNTSKAFKVGDDIVVAPRKKPDHPVSTNLAEEKYDHVKLTTYGGITLIPND